MPLLLFGCAPTTADLIEEAYRTADWSQVEKRLEAESRREERRKPRCGRGFFEVCDIDSDVFFRFNEAVQK